jgi:ABC-2 type transport system ATP-binding protein
MEVERICDRVVIMSRGRIIREGTVDELTPLTGRVAFELERVPADLERLLSGLGQGLERTESGCELALDQAQQDAAIDRLRAAGVSIRSISPRKLSLEQSFIDLVQGERP